MYTIVTRKYVTIYARLRVVASKPKLTPVRLKSVSSPSQCCPAIDSSIYTNATKASKYGHPEPSPFKLNLKVGALEHMMLHKSLYPNIPSIPPQNFHHLLFHRPDQKQWDLNFTLYIDAVTGEKRSYREFYEFVIDGATALGSPVSEHGLGLDGEIVGILSENCTVSSLLKHCNAGTLLTLNIVGLHNVGAGFTGNNDTVRSPFIALHGL